MTPQPDEKGWVLDLYRQVAAQTTPDGFRDFAYRHPVLLSVQALQIMLASKCDREFVALLDEMRLDLWENPETFPHGCGPLDEAIDGLRTRELSYAEAHARATRLDCAGLLSSTYLKVVFAALIEESWKGGAFAAQAAELVLDSAWSMPFVGLAVHVRAGAARGFILVAHVALTKNPDGRLLDRAHEAGAWAIDHVDWSANPAGRGELLHELGVMELDAYTSKWAAGPGYVDDISAWLARATTPMPEPSVALARVDTLLTQAALLRRPGSDRGATLKALLQAKIFEAAAAGSQPDRDELRDVAHRALQNLDAGSELNTWAISTRAP